MKNRIKNWLIVMMIGVIGIALVTVYLMGTGQMMSYEARKTYQPEGGFQSLQADVARAQVTVVPTLEAPRVEVYAKAWLQGPIDLDQRFFFQAEGQTLVLKEIPFEATFFGFFPQPYEMTITAYVPQAVYDEYAGGA